MYHTSTRKKNLLVDALSKEGVQLKYDQWHITEEKNDEYFSYYHKPFKEGGIE